MALADVVDERVTVLAYPPSSNVDTGQTVVRSQPAGGRPWISPRSMILIVGVPATDGWAHRVIMIADRQNLLCGM